MLGFFEIEEDKARQLKAEEERLAKEQQLKHREEWQKPVTCEYCHETSPNAMLFQNNHHLIPFLGSCITMMFRGNRRLPEDCAWFDKQGLVCKNSQGEVHEH